MVVIDAMRMMVEIGDRCIDGGGEADEDDLERE